MYPNTLLNTSTHNQNKWKLSAPFLGSCWTGWIRHETPQLARPPVHRPSLNEVIHHTPKANKTTVTSLNVYFFLRKWAARGTCKCRKFPQQLGDPILMRKKKKEQKQKNKIIESWLCHRNLPAVSTERWAETFLIEFCILGIPEDFRHNQYPMIEQLITCCYNNIKILCMKESCRIGNSSPPE